MAFGALAYDPMTGLAITPDEPDPRAPVVVTPQGPFSKAVNRLAGTQFGEPRMQTWPEKLVRSAATLPGDVVSGEQPMLPPGLRREDYTDAPPPSGLTVTAQPNDPAYERAQDLAGMAGGGMMFGRLGGLTAATVGRDARVLGRKVGSGEPFQHQLIDQPIDAARPPWVSYPPGNPGYAGAQMPRFDLEHRPRGAVDASIDADLGWHANDAGLTTVRKTLPRPWETGSLLEDATPAGAPIAALEHAPKFYSGLERAVDAVPQPKMTGEQWLGTLNNRGVKPEEMDWTGLRGFLADRGNQPVTKAQVAEHLAANKLELGEVHRGDLKFDEKSPYALPQVIKAARQAGETPGDLELVLANDGDAYRALTKKFPGLAENEDWAQIVSKSVFGGDTMPAGTTKFQDYQLPGATNYREKLLTLPDTRAPGPKTFVQWAEQEGLTDGPDARARYSEWLQDNQAVTAGANFRSSHWEEPNVLVHRRTNERDVNGQPSLHIEEIQSDWHQAGRKGGYKSDAPIDKSGMTASEVERYGTPYWQVLDKGGNHYFSVPKEGQERGPLTTAQEAIDFAIKTKRATDNQSAVPDAPFKKNWHELALKDAIREAAEKGIDRISWTPGEAQAARYDLSKHVKEIEYVKNSDGTYRLGVADKEGEPVGALPGMDVNRMTAPQIEQAFGKEIAEKVTKGEGKKYRGHDGFTLEGVDLKVGGEGMKGFYDKMIPDALNKIGKPHGVKVQMGAPATAPKVVNLKNGRGEKFLGIEGSDAGPFRNLGELNKWWKENGDVPVHYMDIPQSLKDQALKKGFSLFEDSAAAGAPVAAIEHAGHHPAIQQAFHDEMGPQAGQSAYEEYLAAHGGQ